MKIIVGKHDIRVVNEAINEKEMNITNCSFEFDDDITSDYNKEAYFTKGNDTYKMIILDDACEIPNEIMQSEGKVEIGVSYFKIEDNETTRYNPTPAYFYILEGSLKDKTKNGLVIKTPSELEQFEDEIENYIKTINIDIDVSKEGNATTVTATNANGEQHSSTIYDGVDGETGPQGPEGPAGKDGTDGKDGKDGQDGQDGVSPIITTNKVDKTTTITITDADGTKTATILDGQDGQNGQDGRDGTDGTNGTDGFSPVANVSKTGNTATITITDAVGTTSTTISDGTNGTNGTDGQDGYSPSASVTKSGSTATISITDKNSTTTATVSDGTNGTDGYTPVKGVDYFTQEDIASLNIPDDLGDLTNNAGYIKGLVQLTYGTSTWNDFKTAYDANKVVYCYVNGRMAFMAYVSNNSVEFQYYRSLSSPSASSQVDEVYVYKLTNGNAWSTTTRNASTSIANGTGISTSYTTGTRTMNIAVDTSTIATRQYVDNAIGTALNSNY